ncbi:hypothetical protein AX27061_5407 [Achromobacter xylosoxidans NBRC 15126 = ATCC 27061]|nr:hypothetical protein AX27061_5407 [Achromobacter xylosoxidans NBRC 15126 = ATCC 27061]CCH06872.1 hypothetical protein NH44784_029111 [Achromobacter xylosoxidans NH44784-1996]
MGWPAILGQWRACARRGRGRPPETTQPAGRAGRVWRVG